MVGAQEALLIPSIIIITEGRRGNAYVVIDGLFYGTERWKSVCRASPAIWLFGILGRRQAGGCLYIEERFQWNSALTERRMKYGSGVQN